ncbi:diaminobutyrate acetyltransferase [Paenibacillus urinalis]|uniref:L-2,4-diaminobutyric acid acetyltransferase n=1 Tax=Paenibacillus urinalis TaxID=521520 RepID=A0ABY7X454_9BACL|nr:MULTISPECIES: diaminobutyrate acetyltransferase [Paenibacillus]WDH96650.1 diaminobutyrate acetyltransferase [Paenibacillus urinalis]WDI00294.1 diaminobutyrate acetyltransferase [Paenibacillus urinalis]GAK40803.1 L-2,4-diaminobutyric acid acetyltransferase [Paenibacillus sp. TCA20]
MTVNTQKEVTYRQPAAEDGSRIWELIRGTGSLDLNSPYCYMMLGDYFKDTCIVAEDDENIVGFISAFRSPRNPETLFVWQVAVASSHRRQGIAKSMLTRLLKHRTMQGVRFIEATVSPSNMASRRLFLSFAEEKSIPSTVTVGYGKELFPNESIHEDEPLFVIGPFFNDI